MDLLSSLLVRRQGKLAPAFTSINPRKLEGLFPSSSMASSAPPSSSPQELLSSQGFAASQTVPDHFRPPSCGQMAAGDEDRKATFEEMFGPGSQFYKDHYENASPTATEELDGLSMGTPNLQSMEDFERENPYKPVLPKEKLISIGVSKPTGEFSTKFAHQCDQHQVRPVFTYHEVAKNHFTAQVAIGDEAIELTEPQPSKKHAKDEVCRLALERMPKIEKMEGLDKRGKKRKSGEALENPQSRRDDSENWVGILNSAFDISLFGGLED